MEVNSLHQCKIQWLNMESKLKHTESMINQSFKGKSTPWYLWFEINKEQRTRFQGDKSKNSFKDHVDKCSSPYTYD